mmetsp:Transcript_47669/g.91010  ORF Transcript_47669/g.91010 Transcript_47669/m.91010 type:complete len:296 (+) Transcript_47669:107-994(+)
MSNNQRPTSMQEDLLSSNRQRKDQGPTRLAFPPVLPRSAWAVGDGKYHIDHEKSPPGRKLRAKLCTQTKLKLPLDRQTFSDLEKTVDKAQFSLLKAEIDIRKGPKKTKQQMAEHQESVHRFNQMPSVFHRLATDPGPRVHRRFKHISLQSCAPSNPDNPSSTSHLPRVPAPSLSSHPASVTARTSAASFLHEIKDIHPREGVGSMKAWFENFGAPSVYALTTAKATKGFMTSYTDERSRGHDRGHKQMTRGNLSINKTKKVPFPSAASRFQMNCAPVFGPGLWINRGHLAESLLT